MRLRCRYIYHLLIVSYQRLESRGNERGHGFSALGNYVRSCGSHCDGDMGKGTGLKVIAEVEFIWGPFQLKVGSQYSSDDFPCSLFPFSFSFKDVNYLKLYQSMAYLQCHATVTTF